MRTPVFTGSCPALVTPFDQNGNINYDAFGRLIDAQIEAGVDAVCVCGTTGESATMSIREHNAAVEYCVKRVNKRVKVIAGAGSNDTSAAVYLSQHAQDYGADALLHVTPYYNKASQTGLIKHYEYIAERTEDKVLDRNAYENAKQYFPAGYTEKIIAGGNHAQFGNYGAQSGDGEATITNQEQQTQTAFAIVQFAETIKPRSR